MIYFWEEFVLCSVTGNLIKLIYATCIILYLYQNFEKVLDNMESEMETMEQRSRSNSQ